MFTAWFTNNHCVAKSKKKMFLITSGDDSFARLRLYSIIPHLRTRWYAMYIHFSLYKKKKFRFTV